MMKRTAHTGRASVPSGRWLFRALLLAPLALGGGCVAAAVGAGAVAAGAVGAVAYTDRGAKGDVKGDVDRVRRQTEAVFAQMSIRTTESNMKKGGAEQELKALGQGKEVSVRIVTVNPQVSQVEVDVSHGLFNWDKEYARQILSKIVQQTG